MLGSVVVWQTVKSDLDHMAALWGVPQPMWAVRAAAKLALHPRVRAVMWFRVSHALWERQWLQPLALLIQGHAIRSAGAEIHPAARIGPGLNLSHSVGVVIGHEVVAGADLTLFQGVTLGHGSRPGQPCLGDRVRVFAGAKVLGGVVVGHDAVIAAGAVVVDDVPARHLAAGVPATVRAIMT
jgi:serine O-acetyltransferase